MRLEAFLCDAATVREGLLHILGAGVSRIPRPSFPAPLNAQLAMVATLMPVEARTQHSLAVVVQGMDGLRVAEVTGQFGVGTLPAGIQPGEPLAVPIVLDLRQVMIPGQGTYSVEVLVDSQLAKSLPFMVSQVPAPPH
jgi:hypothetical protein